MGRPYSSDLTELSATYKWASSFKTPALLRAVSSAAEVSLTYVGSGGSYSVAVFGSQLHNEYSEKGSRSLTPLEASTVGHWRDVGAMVLTAGGGNPDILGITEQLVKEEPIVLGAICSRKRSKLSRIAHRFQHIEITEAEPPTGKDSFLATKSLLSSCIFLHRAYCDVFGRENRLPPSYRELLPPDLLTLSSSEPTTLSRPSLVVLYGPSSAPAAIDLESKINEAGLGYIQIADYRNFAHGRHTGLDARSAASGVLAFACPEDEGIASKTLKLIPREIPRFLIRIPFCGAEGSISAMVAALNLIGTRARLLRLDPGRPKVPLFGRKLYHLKVWPVPDLKVDLPPPVIRKMTSSSVESVCLTRWKTAHAVFVEALRATELDGVLLDYDGTLCDARHRFGLIPPPVSKQLVRLLHEGAVVGIATGRGKSVKEALRNIIPKRHWGKLMVGYYNASQIANLGDDNAPNGSQRVANVLKDAHRCLVDHPEFTRYARVEGRGDQLTIEPLRPGFGGRVRSLAVDILNILSSWIRVMHSTHSIDVLAPNVSKLALVRHLEKWAGRELKLFAWGLGVAWQRF